MTSKGRARRSRGNLHVSPNIRPSPHLPRPSLRRLRTNVHDYYHLLSHQRRRVSRLERRYTHHISLPIILGLFFRWYRNITTRHYPTSSGLSTGAIAGIGVSAAIGGIGIIALLVAVILLRRRPKGQVLYNAPPPVQAGSKEIYSGHPVHEMGVDRRPMELPSQR